MARRRVLPIRHSPRRLRDLVLDLPSRQVASATASISHQRDACRVSWACTRPRSALVLPTPPVLKQRLLIAPLVPVSPRAVVSATCIHANGMMCCRCVLASVRTLNQASRPGGESSIRPPPPTPSGGQSQVRRAASTASLSARRESEATPCGGSPRPCRGRHV